MLTLSECTVHGMLEPQSLNGTAATTTELDTANMREIVVVVHFGAIGAGDLDSLTLQESDTSGSNFTNITGLTATVTQTDDNKIVRFNVYKGNPARKRYIKLVVDPAAVATLASAVAFAQPENGSPVSAATAGSYCAAGTRTAGLHTNASA